MIDPVTVAIRLALAIGFGAIVGVEREWRQKHAGLKTMTLVAIGAAGFAMMSNTFGPENHNPGQIAAAVVGGIGFIGAGVIMHRGITVQGVTTAATLWAVASMGVAVGLGQYALGGSLTVGIVVVQLTMRWIEKGPLRRARREALGGRFELRVDCDPETLGAVNQIWRDSELTPIRRSLQRGSDSSTLRLVLRSPETFDVAAMEERLAALQGVRRVDIRHLGVDED